MDGASTHFNYVNIIIIAPGWSNYHCSAILWTFYHTCSLYYHNLPPLWRRLRQFKVVRRRKLPAARVATGVEKKLKTEINCSCQPGSGLHHHDLSLRHKLETMIFWFLFRLGHSLLTQNIKNFVRENFKLLRIVHKSDSSLDTALFKDSSLEPIFNHFVTRVETKEAQSWPGSCILR